MWEDCYDFIDRSKCYRHVYDSDVDQCESGEKCLPYKISSFNLLQKSKNETYSVEMSQNEEMVEMLRKMLEHVCNYIICGNRCRQEQLVEKCGDQGNKICLNFTVE
uniref:Uncharacterized protein n=1 Tax=Romanomermis culicivorax TaxID=13658 RepID=A0A915KSS1_ROMCU